MKIDAQAYQRLIEIGLTLSAEKDINSLLEKILVEAKTIANADAGTLYLVTENKTLAFAIVLNDSLDVKKGSNSKPVTLPEIPLLDANNEPNMSSIAARSVNLIQTVVIDDIYSESRSDSAGARKFDALTGYRSQSFLTVPLKSFAGDATGVLQLLNAKNDAGKIIAFSNEVVSFIEALSSYASVALENRFLLDEHVELHKKLENEVEARTEELRNALSKLSEAHLILKDLTTIDAVTRIKNRHYFDQVFKREWRRAERQKYPLTLLLLDIDHFKDVNDTYGHLAGDKCLASVAGCINRMFNRTSDVAARFGGEEFIVILPYIDTHTAADLAEKIRAKIEHLKINVDGNQISVTVSIGHITEIPDSKMAKTSLIAKADKALYRAKSAGRNRVCDGAENT